MSITYSKWVEPYKNRFVKITIDVQTEQKIRSFVKKLIAKKVTEKHHACDNRNEEKRFTTGLMGEAAIENLLGRDIIEWEVGNSEDYHKPDLRRIGINSGVKTVEWGKFPIVFKRQYQSEVIVLKRDRDLYVCGLASVETLHKYQDDDLILDPNLRDRGTKTGFYGFHALDPCFGSIL